MEADVSGSDVKAEVPDRVVVLVEAASESGIVDEEMAGSLVMNAVVEVRMSLWEVCEELESNMKEEVSDEIDSVITVDVIIVMLVTNTDVEVETVLPGLGSAA